MAPSSPVRFLAAALLAAACAQTAAQGARGEINAYLTVATDAMHHGLSQNDNGSALRAGLDYQHDAGWFAGVSAGTVEYASERWRAAGRDTAIEYYAGFDGRRPRWSWTVALAHYAYPGLEVDYDYTQLNASIAFRRRLSYNIAITDSMLSLWSSAVTHELALRWPLPGDVELGAAAGRFDSDELGGGYDFWNLGASKVLGRFALDLRYHDTRDARLGPLGRPADGRWVLSLSYGLRLAPGRGSP